jgi:hypothetical protein
LLVVSPGREISLAPRRLADKLKIGLVVTEGPVLETIDYVREAVEAPNRLLASLLVDLADALGRLTPAQGVPGVLAVLDTTLGATTALVNQEGRTVTGPELAPPVTVDERLTQPVLRQQRDWYRITCPIVVSAEEGPGFWLAIQIPSPTPATRQVARRAARLAAAPIATLLAAARLRQERDSRTARHVLDAIIASGDHPEPDLLHQIGTLGWQTEGWCTAIHVKAGSEASAVPAWTGALSAAAEQAGCGGELIERPDGWTWWLTDAAEPTATMGSALEARLRAALTAFVATHPGANLHAGVGSPHPQLDGLKKSLTEAQDAASVARASGAACAVRSFSESGVQLLMVGWLASPELADFARTLLSPLLKADQSDQLLHTLEVFLDHESSATATADALGLHRNTVMRRLARLRELLPADLNEPDDRLAVQLACRVVNLHT